MNFPNIEPLEARIAPATISIANVAVAEGNSGKTAATFTVTLSAAATEPVTVDFATSDGTATASGLFPDYEAAQGTVTFAAGVTSKTITVNVLGERIQEGDENFTVALSNPSGSNTIGTAAGVGTINNDGDTLTGVGISNAPSVTEGAGVTSSFTVTLAAPVTGTVTVTYATGATADTAKPAPGLFTDYQAKTGTLTFTEGGPLTQQIAVTITNDTYQEASEQFTVTLTGATNAAVSGKPSAVGQILNDASDTTVGFFLDDVKKVEGNTNSTLVLKPTLSGPIATAFTVTTQDGTAVNGTDFTATPLTIAAGQSTADYSITIKGDTVFEATESFFVNVSGLPAGVTFTDNHPVNPSAQLSARVYLYNDDTQNLGTLGRTAQWIDVDGDLVTMTVNKASLPLNNSNADPSLTRPLFTFTTTNSLGGATLQKLDLQAFGTAFAGASIQITATKQPGFPGASDGRVDVGFINAAVFDPDELQAFGIDLGSITVDGDLAKIRAGDQFSTPAIAKLDVYSLGARGTTTLPSGDTDFESRVLGPISSVVVKQNLESYLHVVGAEFGTIGSLKIGGELKGGSANNSGRVAVSGRLGTATIGKITGGSGDSTGLINGLLGSRASLGNITVLGDIVGGTGNISGALVAPRIGNVTVGSLKGVTSGTDTQSGIILSQTTLGNVTLSGDLLGGGVADSGQISSGANMGIVKIGGKILGGSGDDSGTIISGANVASLTVTGSVTGGDGVGSGSIRAAGNIGSVKIDGVLDSLKGGAGANSGRIDIVGSIASFTATGNVQGGTAKGSGEIVSGSTIGAIKIAGHLIGNSGEDSGSIQSGGNVTSLIVGAISGSTGKGSGSVRVGVDNTGTIKTPGAGIGAVALVDATATDSLQGGTGVNSGRLDVAGNILSFTSTGNVHGGSIDGSGAIVANGNIDKLVIGKSLIGGNSTASVFLNRSGFISATHLKSVTIGEDVLSGSDGGGGIANTGAIRADVIDALTVTRNVTGNFAGATYSPVLIGAKGQTSNLAIKSLKVGGNARFAEILAGYNDATTKTNFRGTPTNADAAIGNIVIVGTVRALDIVAGADPGVDAGSGAGPRFGTTDDKVVTGNVINNPSVFSKIASVIIGGLANDSKNPVLYGIVAQHLALIKVGETTIALTPGATNDRTPINLGSDATFNFRALELGVT